MVVISKKAVQSLNIHHPVSRIKLSKDALNLVRQKTYWKDCDFEASV